MKRIHLLLATLAFVLASCGPQVEVVRPQADLMTDPVATVSATPSFSWQIASKQKDVVQESYRILVAGNEKDLRSGRNLYWDSGVVASDSTRYIPYAGMQLGSRVNCVWKVLVTTSAGEAQSRVCRFGTGLLQSEDWRALWIGTASDSDVLTGRTRIPSRYLRREFEPASKVQSAVLYITGLGNYSAFINGKEVGDAVLAPTVSDYDKRVYYNAFDVTKLLQSGPNALAVVLGGGRYSSMRIQANDGIPDIRHYGLPKLCCQLEITYKGGKRDVIVSDGSWKATADGPIRWASEFDGEYYDATRELDGFAAPGYDDSAWAAASVVDAPAGALEIQPNPDICVQDRLTPLSVTALNGSYIIDMGQNMVGWLRIKGQGQPGDTILLRFAETLREDGTLYRDNLRSAEVTDTYIVRDDKPFDWHPRFTYHGFRFVEVSGLRRVPAVTDFEGQVFYDAMATTGSIETSDPVINQVARNAFWGIRGNYRGMPTDCPQRDERMGWFGDRTTGCYGESYLFDNQLLYTKWMQDIEDSQTASGSLPDIAPLYWNIRSDNITWPGVFVAVADMLYRHYGDVAPIRRHYPAMKLWLQYMKARYGRDGIITKDTYGDWCMPPESLQLIHSQDPTRITPGAVLSTALYYRFCVLMEQFAPLAGEAEDAALWLAEAAETKEAFNREFFHPEGFYANNTVTANILPLSFGMVPEGAEEAVFAHIIDKTEGEFASHVSVGVVGIQQLMRTLTRFGRADLAFRLASETSYPSWGYMVSQGATTIWELWNGNTADPAMNSGNHVMILGDLLLWDFGCLGGIRPVEPGFRSFELRPVVPEGLDWVNCRYDSVYGRIESRWKRAGDSFEWTFTIPANTRAAVYLPGESEATVYGSGTYTVNKIMQ